MDNTSYVETARGGPSAAVAEAASVEAKGRLPGTFQTVFQATCIVKCNAAVREFHSVLLYAMKTLNGRSGPCSISISDKNGYYPAQATFRVHLLEGGRSKRLGVACIRAVDRNARKVGNYPTLDFIVKIHYRILSSGRHSVHADYYLLRCEFNQTDAWLSIAHRGGMRRVALDEFLTAIRAAVNQELKKRSLGTAEIELLKSIE